MNQNPTARPPFPPFDLASGRRANKRVARAAFLLLALMAEELALGLEGFVPRIRDELTPTLTVLQTVRCPLKNLPERTASRWGESITTEKMDECRRVNPKLVCQVVFIEWTDAAHLRHCTFIGMRDDKKPAEVVRET